MKVIWSSVFFASSLFLLLCSFATMRRKTRLSFILRVALLLTAVSNLAAGAVVATSSSNVAMIAFAVCSICNLWILYCFVEFSLVYTVERLHYTVLHTITICILIFDSVSYASNFLFHHVFTIFQHVEENGEIFFTRVLLVGGAIHLVICYTLLTIAIGTLIRHMRKVPTIYWAKYLLVIAFSALAIVFQALFLSLHLNINYMQLSMAVAEACITYFALFYRPRLIIDRMLARVVDKSDDYVFFFDITKKCIFVNKKARAFFGIKSDAVHESFSVLSIWFEGMNFTLESEPATFVCTRVWNGQLTHLKVSYERLYGKNKLIGTFFHIHDITGEVNRYEVQEYRANHDELTGLYTREYLFQRIHRELLVHIENEYFLVLTDVKDFKLINDIFGRQMGDELLINAAHNIREAFGSRALYGRVGYDRFCLLINQDMLEEFKQSFVANLDQVSHLSNGTFYPVQVHLGIYPVSERGMTVSAMLDHASIALESIKDSREISFAYYTNGMRQQRLWEQKIISQLGEALEKRQFEIYLQPQADTNGKVGGAEVLVRWNHPEKGLLSPSEFVPVFEKNGQIIKMDVFVWEEACRLLQKWKQSGHEDFYLSVNISPKDFYYIDVHQKFCDLVEQYGVNPARLKLEITETVMITDLEQKIQLIDKLHDSGFAVEMDDFGSGYSSLNMLKSIPVDVLKIDMAFLYHAKEAQRSRTIIRQVVVLSKELGIPVITEGVETEEQVVFLREIGCEMFQGYYFDRPLRVSEFEAKYLKPNNGADDGNSTEIA